MNDEERKKALGNIRKLVKVSVEEDKSTVRTLPQITEHVVDMNTFLEDIIPLIEDSGSFKEGYGFSASFPVEDINVLFTTYGIDVQIPVFDTPSIKEKGKIANYINAISNSCLQIRSDRRVVWGFRNKKGSSVIKAKIYTDKPVVKKAKKGD